MSPPPEVVVRIGEVVLWIPVAFYSGANQQYKCTGPPGGMESNLRPFPTAYELYLFHLARRIRGTVVIT